jgi:hypothetical protein
MFKPQGGQEKTRTKRIGPSSTRAIGFSYILGCEIWTPSLASPVHHQVGPGLTFLGWAWSSLNRPTHKHPTQGCITWCHISECKYRNFWIFKRPNPNYVVKQNLFKFQTVPVRMFLKFCFYRLPPKYFFLFPWYIALTAGGCLPHIFAFCPFKFFLNKGKLYA